jgi:hypothetical protein
MHCSSPTAAYSTYKMGWAQKEVKMPAMKRGCHLVTHLVGIGSQAAGAAATAAAAGAAAAAAATKTIFANSSTCNSDKYNSTMHNETSNRTM